MSYATKSDLWSTALKYRTERSRLDVAQAAEQYRIVDSPPKPAMPWRNAMTPYLREPMQMLTSRRHNAVVFVGPSQCGKTSMIENWILYSAVVSQADLMLVQSTQAEAGDFKHRRVDRMKRSNKELRAQMSASPRDDNTYEIRYRSGTLLTLSWPTVSELSGKPIPRVALTDFDRMPLDIDHHGNAFDLARERTKTFGTRAMTLCESSPGQPILQARWRKETPHQAPPCKGIFALYNRGDRRRWYWPCLHCNEYFIPEFEHLTWPDTKDAKEASEGVRMACPACGGLHEQHLRTALNRRGVWVPDGMHVDPKGNLHGEPHGSQMVSYWLTGAAATWQPWDYLVLTWLQAWEEYERTGNEQSIKVTVNGDQGKAYLPMASNRATRAPEVLQERRDFELAEREVPKGVRFLTVTADVARDRFDLMVVGWGVGLECWIIDYFPIERSERPAEFGDGFEPLDPAGHEEDWRVLERQMINKAYPLDDGSGRVMLPKLTGCDSGGAAGVTNNAYAFYRRVVKLEMASRFILLKGGARNALRLRRTFPDERTDTNTTAKGDIPLYLLNSEQMKDTVDSMLERDQPGPGYVHFPAWLPDSFYDGLTAESRDPKKGWVQKPGMKNEPWDLLTYNRTCVVALKAEGMNWEQPLPWADEWDRNTLVITPKRHEEIANRAVPQVRRTRGVRSQGLRG